VLLWTSFRRVDVVSAETVISLIALMLTAAWLILAVVIIGTRGDDS
jgi:hypothetical protein